MDPEITQTAPGIDQPTASRRALPFFIVIIVLALFGLTAAAVNINTGPQNDQNSNQNGLSGTPEPDKIITDSSSINTIVYGFKEKDDLVNINAVNDSALNNSKVATISEGVKFVIPLKNKKQLIFIGGIPATVEGGDKGTTIVVKNIVPDKGEKDGKSFTIYTAKQDYKIDSLIISQNNEWISWSENKPPEGSADLHTKNFFRTFKANIGAGPITGSSKINPIPLTSEKSETGVIIKFPVVITNSGAVYFNGMRPADYSLHNGIINEANETILPINSYNSQPTLNKERYLLFTSFEPNNKPQMPAGEGPAARLEVVNKNSIKVFDLQNPSTPSVVVGPGDKGEHYNHPFYVSGDPTGEFLLATEVGKIEQGKFVLTEIQTIKKLSSGGFEKKTILEIGKGGSYRILAVGQKPNGNKTLIVGKEIEDKGSLGRYGYQFMLSSIITYDITSNNQQIPSETKLIPAAGEFLGVMDKSTSDMLGIDRNETLPSLKDRQQLQLETFVPVIPKRKRSNPRSVCETEWQKKGYSSYEDCEACPLYVYSDVPRNVIVKPNTPISAESAVPSLENGVWSFVADKAGNLLFPDNSVHKRIDFFFPRGAIVKPTAGLIIEKGDYERQIASYAKSLGFNDREAKDVVDFYLPQINDSKYIFLSTLSKEQTKKLLDFEVSPMPQVQETRMFYIEKLSQKPAIEPQKPVYSPFTRSAFSVVTWGGMVR